MPCSGPVPSGVVWAAWEQFVHVEPWENLESNPRTAPTARIRLVTYNNWFAVPHGTGGTQEKGYPPGMPNYIKHSGGIPFSQVKQLIRFRTGAHYLRVETERWVPVPARLPRSERVCQKCTLGSVMEDEYHVLFECPTYHHIRLKHEEALFSNFGGVSRAARSMRPSGKVSAFMNQNPRKVAAFVSECLDYRHFEASDLLPYATRETLEELGLVIKLIRFRLTMMIILMSLAWRMMPMEPSLAPLRAPPLWGHFVICNLEGSYILS